MLKASDIYAPIWDRMIKDTADEDVQSLSLYFLHLNESHYFVTGVGLSLEKPDQLLLKFHEEGNSWVRRIAGFGA